MQMFGLKKKIKDEKKIILKRKIVNKLTNTNM